MIKFEYNGDSIDGFAGDKITFEFDNDCMPVDQVFMRWVRFMNAAGYVLDPVEMESLWMGVERERQLEEMFSDEDKPIRFGEV